MKLISSLSTCAWIGATALGGCGNESTTNDAATNAEPSELYADLLPAFAA